MPQKGIHPLLRTCRVVMRNGASFEIQTTMNRLTPYMLQTDTTNNPIYTGESAGLSLEDERMQKLMSKYEGFIPDGQADSGEAAAAAAAAAAPPPPSSSSSSSDKGGPPVKGGKKKKK